MTGSKKDTSSNPGTNPDSKTSVPGLKDPIPPEKEWPPGGESYNVKPRVIIKRKESDSLPSGGFTAADLFYKESVDTPDFAGNISFKPLFRRGLLKCIRKRFEDTKRDDIKKKWPNPEAYYSAEVEDPKQREWLLNRTRRSDEVEQLYLHPGPVEPPQVITGNDPLSHEQTYLDEAPTGIDARYAWTVPGGDGKNLRLADVEWGWNHDHEDLEGINFTKIRNGSQKAWPMAPRCWVSSQRATTANTASASPPTCHPSLPADSGIPPITTFQLKRFWMPSVNWMWVTFCFWKRKPNVWL